MKQAITENVDLENVKTLDVATLNFGTLFKVLTAMLLKDSIFYDVTSRRHCVIILEDTKLRILEHFSSRRYIRQQKMTTYVRFSSFS